MPPEKPKKKKRPKEDSPTSPEKPKKKKRSKEDSPAPPDKPRKKKRKKKLKKKIKKKANLKELEGQNQMIKKGDRIGKIGQTGVATGPHLHWGMSVQNVRVNPLFWVEKNKLN